MYSFTSRHPQLSFRKPEAKSINDIMEFNKRETDKFFENLENLIFQYNLKQHTFTIMMNRALLWLIDLVV